MAMVRMSLQSMGTGKQLIVRGTQTDAVRAAENFRAVLQEKFSPARRALHTTYNPARPSFFKPSVTPTPQGAEMSFKRPPLIDQQTFEEVVEAAVERFRACFPTPLFVS